MSERIKLIVAVVLIVAMVVVVGFQVSKIAGGSRRQAAPPPSQPSQVEEAPSSGAAQPDAAAPARGAAPVRGEQPLQETPVSIDTSAQAQPEAEPKESLQSKISFVDQEIEERYRQSRYFVRNPMGPIRDPFVPPAALAPVKQIAGVQQEMAPLQAIMGGDGSGAVTGEGGIPEISLLPLPSEIVEEKTHFTFLGYSLGRKGSTGLFRMGEAADGGAAAAEGNVIMAHEGWLVGNDYIFLGIKGDKAELLNRKEDNIILLSTGETV